MIRAKAFSWLAISAAIIGAAALTACPAPAHAQDSMFGKDKLYHATGTAVLSATLLEVQRRNPDLVPVCAGSERTCAFAGTMLVGLIKETLPPPYNSGFSYKDMIANAVGAGIGIYVHGLIVTPRSVSYTWVY